MNNLSSILYLIFFAQVLDSQAQGSPFIRLDQFGYLPNSSKVAIIADPVIGFDSAQSFTPGNLYEVRRTRDNQTVFSAAPVVWNNGAVHAQSGDRGWWFDFSALTSSGEYYLYDTDNKVSSHPFKIDADVYREILVQAVRTYYYQRLNCAKQVPFTDPKWADAICYDGPDQDRAARNRWTKADSSSAKDVHGGWMDAGDVNKYTTFAEGAVLQLFEAYRRNPAAFTDDFNIPESGNGIPDLLDELRYELDFLKRMQDATGTNGFLLKVGVDNYNDVSPLSADKRPRYYLPECTSATLSGCAMFAQAGVVFSKTVLLENEGKDFVARAELAWKRAEETSSGFSKFETECDDGDIKAGDADRSASGQLESALTAAVYLFEATGKDIYRRFVAEKSINMEPISNNYWGAHRVTVQVALLRFAGMPGVDSTFTRKILQQKSAMNYAFSLDNFRAKTDLYRAYMDDQMHHWGSNRERANCGNLNLDFVIFNINPTQKSQYRDVAEQYLHWLHGANPLNLVMLTNMYAFGGDNCANEIYHYWFANNTPYDNALSSPLGPPPGYLTGGPNMTFSVKELSPPAGQPAQKAYLDFNDGFPKASWEITEPAIYYNAAYIQLLSGFIKP